MAVPEGETLICLFPVWPFFWASVKGLGATLLCMASQLRYFWKTKRVYKVSVGILKGFRSMSTNNEEEKNRS